MFKISALSLTTLVFSVLLKKILPEFSVLLTVSVGLAIFLLVEGSLTEIIVTLETLSELSNIDRRLFTPVIKTVAISILCKTTGGICRSAGEDGIASFVDFGGTVLSIVIALPLVEGVMTLIVGML